MSFIYLDYNATTPVAPEVVDAMLPYLRERYGNPSSGHAAALLAREGLDRAREQVAALIACDADEVVFTGGASEANNLCLKGSAWAARSKTAATGHASHAITGAAEHPSVLKVFGFLEEYERYQVSIVPVDACGMVSAEAFAACVRPETRIVSCMLAQNEVGTLQPVGDIVRRVKEANPWAVLHCDASQAAGKVPVNVRDLGVDLMVLAGHKIYGPKGIAAVYLRKGVEMVPLVHGMDHERGRRAGTENLPGIVGLGMACELARTGMEAVTQHAAGMRDRLWERLKASIPGIIRNGHPVLSLPNTLNVCLPGVDSPRMLAELKEVLAVSSGAACHWGVTEPSPVLTAMGISREVALGAVRFSVGRSTTPAEIDSAADLVAQKARELASV